MNDFSPQFTDDELVQLGRGEFQNLELLFRIQVAYYDRTAQYIATMVNWARGLYQEVLAGIEIEETFRQLSDFEDAFPQAVEAVVSYPYVGSWANATVRDHGRMARSEELWSIKEVLPREVAHLGCVTAAIALHAQRSSEQLVPFSVIVPVGRGMIRLPSLGAIKTKQQRAFVRLTNSERGLEYCELDGGEPVLVLPQTLEQPTSLWEPLKKVSSTVNGQAMCVFVDDIDAHAADTREGDQADLSDPEQPSIEKWRAVFDEAWQILVHRHPDQARSAACLLRSFVPLKAASPYEGRSATAQDALGSIMLTFPGTGQELARIIVHEIRHALFGAITRQANFFVGVGQPLELTRVPWRPDSRQRIALLDGVFSFAGEIEFWGNEYLARLNNSRLSQRAEFELARWTAPTLTTLRQIPRSMLTPQGAVFTDAIEQRLLAAPVPPTSEVVVAAEQSEASHLLEFELRCTEPLGNWLQECAQAFEDGKDFPASVLKQQEWHIVAVHQRYFSQARQDLLRVKALFPDFFETLRGDFAMAAQEVPGLTPADMAFALGDFVQARTGYEQQIVSLPDSVQAWAGLGLSDCYVNNPQQVTHHLRAVRIARSMYVLLRIQGKQLPAPTYLVNWVAQGIQ